MLVDKDKLQDRISICQGCEHYTSSGTCGTLIVGTTLDNGIHLCGCLMHVKARLKFASCPIGKWVSEISKEDIETLRSLSAKFKVQYNPSGTSANVEMNTLNELYIWWNKHIGKRKITTCFPCIIDFYQDLQNILKDADS